MYKRDVGVLLLAVWAVFVSLRTEGPIGFSKSFYLRFPRADSSRHDRRFMPRPHSVDLNGDGKPEFVTTTPGGEQLILAAPRKGGDGFQEALVLARVDVGSLSGAEGSRVISLAHGSLDPPMNDFVHAPRRHVVAALCSDGQLLLLDSNLKLRWKSSIPGALSDESSGGVYTLKDISLAITPHGVNDREHGMVVAMMSVMAHTSGGLLSAAVMFAVMLVMMWQKSPARNEFALRSVGLVLVVAGAIFAVVDIGALHTHVN